VELNWPTFALEIVNFLILVWILKRFLYKPVLEAIARRKAAIDKTLSDAQARQSDAQTLEEQYRSRLGEWESEKERLRVSVREEVEAQREQLMASLHESLAQEQAKARAVEEHRLSQLESQAIERGTAQGAQFAARFLSRVASPEVESRLTDVLLQDMPLLPADQLHRLRTASGNGDRSVKVTSAFPLQPAQRDAITRKLQELSQDRISAEFQEDSRLLAGLRISIGPFVLRANIEDELAFFAEALRHGS